MVEVVGQGHGRYWVSVSGPQTHRGLLVSHVRTREEDSWQSSGGHGLHGDHVVRHTGGVVGSSVLMEGVGEMVEKQVPV